ncbi:hypothetical protein JCM5353_001945 [Sporobolomyces roseus]
MPATLANYSLPPGVSVTSPEASTSSLTPSTEELTQHYVLSLRLIDAILEGNQRTLVEKLVLEEKVDCWIQDELQGWSSLHAAAYVGDVKLLKFLLRKGNAVWNLVDALGCSAGDIAYSMNNTKAYKFLMQEGIRAEMLRAVMEDAAQLDNNNNNDDEEELEEEAKSTKEAEPQEEEEDTNMNSSDPPQPSTASSLSHYLSQPLTYVKDTSGQDVCLDSEGNGVMMGWEREIMKETVSKLLEQGWGDRKGKKREVLIEEEEGDRTSLTVVNVGFGLGIIDEHFQDYSPTTHLIIEAHPDVLKYAEEKGWMSKPGVRFYRGTWQEWIKDLESGKEEWLEFDGIYFDTYSEHYIDLRSFLSQTPNLLSSSNPLACVSFFHGLGATSRSFYDIYTEVSALHLLEFGLKTEWSEVEVLGQEGDAWESTSYRGETEGGKGERKKYWEWEKAVGKYRLPVCRLDY